MRLASLLLTAAFLLPLHPAVAQAPTAAPALYDQLCATCHGADLDGGNGPSLIDETWVYGRERPAVARIITDGLAEQGMPAFGQVLSTDQVDALTTFVLDASRPDDAQPDRDPVRTLDYEMQVEVFADGLDLPWAIAFLDASTALVTERGGALRLVEDGRLHPEPIAGTPGVLAEGQGGLLDVAVDPDYAENGWIYLAYSHALSDAEDAPAMTRVVRGRLRDHAWVDQEVVFEAPHDTYIATGFHYGTRIVFTPDGHLYFAIGDRGRKELAQDLSRPNGKIHRLHPDGSIPADNPFVDEPGALPSIYSYGHRNPQGLSVHPETGEVWAVEHGPRGGDELNRIVGDTNYGWPVITYGINYNGTVITEERMRPGMAQPVFYWRPSIAVSGLDFYTADAFDRWTDFLLVSALKDESVRLLNVHDGRVLHEEVILKDEGRVREAVTGPDGAIYVVLNEPGQVLRLSPERRIIDG